jgi:hypothetical protein
MPRFVAALFIIAKLWNQPRYTSMDEGMKTIWYIEFCQFCVVYTNVDQTRNHHKLNKPVSKEQVLHVLISHAELGEEEINIKGGLYGK